MCTEDPNHNHGCNRIKEGLSLLGVKARFLRDWVGRKGLRLYSLFWAGGWRLLECAWGRVIMWPLGTPDPQQKPGVPLSVGCSRILQTEKCLLSSLLKPVSGVASLLLYNSIFPSKNRFRHVHFKQYSCPLTAKVRMRGKWSGEFWQL